MTRLIKCAAFVSSLGALQTPQLKCLQDSQTQSFTPRDAVPFPSSSNHQRRQRGTRRWSHILYEGGEDKILRKDYESSLKIKGGDRDSSVTVSTKEKDASDLEDSCTGTDNMTVAQAIFLLNAVAIIWGTQHSVIKMVVEDCDASAFSFARFILAAAIASPFTPNIQPFVDSIKSGTLLSSGTSDQRTDEDLDEENALAWRWGLEMGMWMFLGYAFQAIGLEYTTAQRSGFLLYLNVKFVPFFARILFGRKISISTWASAFTALAGTALLSYDGTATALNIGDSWSIAAAAASAMFILRLEAASSAVKNSAALNSASLWTVTIATFFWCIGDALTGQDAAVITTADLSLPSTIDVIFKSVQSTTSNVWQTVVSHPVELVYLGGITTAVANYIQTKAQRGISAERASLIYALDPVYGAFFANVLLGEKMTELGMVGAGLITLAAATNAVIDFGASSDDKSEEIQNEFRSSGDDSVQ